VKKSRFMIDHKRQSCHLCNTSHVPQYHQQTCHSYTSKAFSLRPYETPKCTILFSSYAPFSYYSTPPLPLPPPRSSRPRNPPLSSPHQQWIHMCLLCHHQIHQHILIVQHCDHDPLGTRAIPALPTHVYRNKLTELLKWK